MYIESLSLDINKISKYTKDDIKDIYKKIALECHPDKLINITDINEKNMKIDKFKKACVGYKKALEDFENYGELRTFNDFDKDDIMYSYDFYNDADTDINFWNNMYNNYFNDKEAIKTTFMNIANMFLKKGVKSKNYYNPSTKIIKHSIILPVNYYDLYTNKNKKIRILLKGVKKPFNFSILCKKVYPCFTRQYIDDDGIEHEIEIKMIISNKKDINNGIDYSSSSGDTDNEDLDYERYKLNNKKIEYRHKITNDKIDLIIDIFINLKDYLIGATKLIKYIDGNYINIEIPPFTLNNICLNNKGLLGGKLIINITLLNISKINWDSLDFEKKDIFIKFIDNIYKN
jgi:DnaJ-class molecular chaperone